MLIHKEERTDSEQTGQRKSQQQAEKVGRWPGTNMSVKTSRRGGNEQIYLKQELNFLENYKSLQILSTEVSR